MQLLSTESVNVRKVSYTVLHNQKEYILTDFFEGANIVDTIILDKDGNTVEEPGILEEITNFLDEEV